VHQAFLAGSVAESTVRSAAKTRTPIACVEPRQYPGMAGSFL